MLFEALSQHQLSAKAAGFYMIAVSLILPLLILIFVYQIVNRNRLSLLSKCVGIPGALLSLVYYVYYGGLGILFPFGVRYETIRKAMSYYTSHPQSSSFPLALATVFYYALLVVAAVAAVALGMCIYNLKRRKLFSLRQTLIVALPVWLIVLSVVLANLICGFGTSPFRAITMCDGILAVVLTFGLRGKKPVPSPAPEPESVELIRERNEK